MVECPDYDPERVFAAVRKGIDLLGGIGRFVSREEKILLKPNLLVAAEPEKAVTTHPAVLPAVARLCLESKARVSFGDSPAWGSPSSVAAKAGLTAVAREIGLEQADFLTPVTVSFNEALIAKQLVLAKGVLETDGIISLAKMKSHGFMRITGAVKNQFGCVPGLRKGEFHVKMPQAGAFRGHAGRHQPLSEATALCHGRHRGHGRQWPEVGHSANNERPAFFQRSRRPGRRFLPLDRFVSRLCSDHETRA